MREPVTANRRKNAPQGCKVPVLTHLTAKERSELDQLAAQEMRSLSSTMRMICLKGLAAHQAEKPAPSTH